MYPPETTIHEGLPNDLNTLFFRNGNLNGPIELPNYSPAQLDSMLMVSLDPPEPLSWEPAVPNTYSAGESFKVEGITHVILAQSPGYTPRSADLLIPIIKEYFYPA